MKALIPTKRTTLLFVVALLLIGFGLEPVAQAVFPPPDGGYPGGNTAEGQAALLSRTSGTFDTAIGFLSLRGLTTANYNTGVGAGTLALNNAENNTAVGTAALLFNTTGEGNTATGAFALFSNTQGQFNTANGEFTLYWNTIGERNTAIGDSALYLNTEGSYNTAIGNTALLSNTVGDGNTATGFVALRHNTDGSNNTANGYNALTRNTTGNHNTANGFNALLNNTTGTANTAMGNQTLQSNTTGSVNTALGNGAGDSVTTADNVICIGFSVSGANVSDSCYIGNIWNQPGGSQAVYVNSDGKLGAQVSSRRFKDEIKQMEQASEVIYSLKPVSFRYKPEIEPARPLGFGLIAEEVEKINSDLVARDKEGKPYSVRYDAVNAMLLNEFLKEHRKVEELRANAAKQEATISELKKDMGVLTAHLREQAAQIQKVSAQLEATKPAPQVVNNP